MDNEFDMRCIKELDEPIFVVYSSVGEDEGVIEMAKFIGINKDGIIEPIVMMDGSFEFVGDMSNYYGCYTKEALIEHGVFLDIANAIKPKVDKKQ